MPHFQIFAYAYIANSSKHKQLLLQFSKDEFETF